MQNISLFIENWYGSSINNVHRDDKLLLSLMWLSCAFTAWMQSFNRCLYWLGELDSLGKSFLSLSQLTNYRSSPRGKCDGVIRHILEHKKVNWMKKLCYCVNDQSGIQRDWVNLAWTWISGNFWAWFVRKTCVKAGFRF